MSWWEYVERVANTTRQRDIQDRTGIDASNFSRWKTGQTPRPTLVAQFARAYNRPVLEAFVAAEFLTPEEAAERPAATPSLSTLTDDQLLAEVRARMSRGRDGHGQQSAPKTQPANWRDHMTKDQVDLAADQGEPEKPYDSQDT